MYKLDFVNSLICWWHLGYFHLLATVNSAVRTPVSSEPVLSVHVGKHLGWLDHVIILHLTSDQPPKCLTAPTSFYILTTSAEGHQFVYMLTNTCSFSFACLLIYFGNSHLNICEVVSHCGFYFRLFS